MKKYDSRCSVLVMGRNATIKQAYITALFWERYWPECKYERILLTQTKAGKCKKKYDRVIYTKEEELIWGDRLEAALDSVGTEWVILLTEDYFCTSEIYDWMIDHYIDLAERENAGAIRLNPPALFAEKYNSELDILKETVEYRITGQPTLFRTDYLRHFAGIHLSPWQFERKGTEISRKYEEKVFVTKMNLYPMVHAWSHNSWTRSAIRQMKKIGIPEKLYVNDNRYPVRYVFKNAIFWVVIHIAPHTLNKITAWLSDKKGEKKLNY